MKGLLVEESRRYHGFGELQVIMNEMMKFEQSIEFLFAVAGEGIYNRS